MKEATMRRRLSVSYREHSYISPAAQRLIELLSKQHAKRHDRRSSPGRTLS